MSTSYQYRLYNDDIIGNSKFKELRKMYRTPPPNSALYAQPIASPKSTHAQAITQQSTNNHKQPNEIASGGQSNLDIKSVNRTPSSKQSANNGQSVSKANENLKNKANKSDANAPNARKISFTITTYKDDSATDKTPPPKAKHPHVQHVDAPIKKPIVSTATNGHHKTNANHNVASTKTTTRTIEPNKNSAKSISTNKKKPIDDCPSPVIKWVVYKDSNNALSNVTIAPYDHQQREQNISVFRDHSIGSNESDVELRSTNKFSNGRPISLHIGKQKAVENVIKSPGITIRTVDTLEDISSVELIPRLSIRQLKTILENEAIDPNDYAQLDQLRHKVTKLWLARQLFKEGRTDICQLCLKHKSDCLLLLCGHQTICMSCGEEVDECPVCRAFVVRKVHVYVN